MLDTAELMRLKYSIAAIRERTLSDLNALEAIIDAARPDEPPACPGIPQTREGRKAYFKKHGIRAGKVSSHGRRIAPTKSKAMETRPRGVQRNAIS